MTLKLWLSGLLALAVSWNVTAGDTESEPGQQQLEAIGRALQSGDARALAKYFDTTVEITIFNNEEAYSKTQAEQVIKDFFLKYAPSSFSLIHQGTSNMQSEYGIGTLVTNKGNFRTYIYIKHKSDQHLIQEIRFESDD